MLVVYRPRHKAVCREMKSTTAKLIPSLIANPALYFYLGKALVMLYKLNVNPSPDTPLVAMCEAEICPADAVREVLITTGHVTPGPDDKEEGMLQLRSLEPLDPRTTMESTRMSMWKATKESLRNSGRPNSHVIMLDFTIRGVKWQGTTYSFPIDDLIIEAVNSGGLSVRKSVILGTIVRPSSVQTCLE